MAKFVAYFRVSTSRQAASGLGLDAQEAAVNAYVKQVSGDVIARFTEVESGGAANRAELQKALRECRRSRAMLVVAKLDRLARNVHFISTLLESGVDFIAADMPEANKLTIHVIAAIAEYERQMIGERTRAALQRVKASGKILGNPKLSEVRPRAVAAAKARADANALAMAPTISKYDPYWDMPAGRIAEVLNVEGIRSTRSGYWSAASIIALRKRLRSLGVNPVTH